MPIVRLTAFFKDDDGHGWSETHDKDGGGSITSLTTFLLAFDTLMKSFRRPLLAGDSFYLGCRASYKTADGSTAGDNIENDPPLRGPQTFMGIDLNMTAPEAAIKGRFRNDASTARSDVYLRGFPGTVIVAGVLDFTGTVGAEWKRRADLYSAALVANGYGWVGTTPNFTSRGNVTGYTSNANQTVTLNVTPTNGVAMPAAGRRLAIKFARINRSNSILNRSLVCVIEAGEAAVTTTELIAVAPFENAGSYVATIKGFIPYAALSYYKLAKRKTGRPFGVAPGRLPVQALR